MEHPIEGGGGHDGVAGTDLSPVAEGFIGGEDDGAVVVVALVKFSCTTEVHRPRRRLRQVMGMSFTGAQLGTVRILGLSNGDTNQTWEDIDFGLYLRGDNVATVVEFGTYYPQYNVSFTAGDVFRVSVEGGVVKYKKNGVVYHTSPGIPTYPLKVDSALYTTNSTLPKCHSQTVPGAQRGYIQSGEHTMQRSDRIQCRVHTRSRPIVQAA